MSIIRGIERFADVKIILEPGEMVIKAKPVVTAIENPGKDFKLGRVTETETGKVGWVRRMTAEESDAARNPRI